MGTKSKNLTPFKATHVGTIIKHELEERGMTQKAFAVLVNMQVSHVSELINGKRNITKALAETIEEKLGIPASSLLNIQAKYEYDTKIIGEREESKKHIVSPKIELYNEILEIKTKLDLLLARYEKMMQQESK